MKFLNLLICFGYITNHSKTGTILLWIDNIKSQVNFKLLESSTLPYHVSSVFQIICFLASCQYLTVWLSPLIKDAFAGERFMICSNLEGSKGDQTLCKRRWMHKDWLINWFFFSSHFCQQVFVIWFLAIMRIPKPNICHTCN